MAAQRCHEAGRLVSQLDASGRLAHRTVGAKGTFYVFRRGFRLAGFATTRPAPREHGELEPQSIRGVPLPVRVSARSALDDAPTQSVEFFLRQWLVDHCRPVRTSSTGVGCSSPWCTPLSRQATLPYRQSSGRYTGRARRAVVPAVQDVVDLTGDGGSGGAWHCVRVRTARRHRKRLCAVGSGGRWLGDAAERGRPRARAGKVERPLSVPPQSAGSRTRRRSSAASTAARLKSSGTYSSRAHSGKWSA